ncbi:MAG: GGDEF domain-containing response regulator [Planctomycetota bacterium]|jgi:diguanylate cyclase (GGDEF)-like protein
MEAISRVVLGHYDEGKLDEIRQLITDDEIEVFLTRDGEEILKLVQEHKPELVLMDVLMPGINGFEICRMIKESMGKRYIAVVLLTDRDDAYSRGRARYVEADEILKEPITAEKLETVLKAPYEEMDNTDKILLGKKEKHDKFLSSLVKGRTSIKPDGLMAKISDPLTGLCNRAYMHLKLEEEFKKSKRYGTPLSCILVDIDNFEDIYNRHGKGGANEVLVEVGSMLLCESRDIDIAGRIEDSKFLLLLPNTDLDGAKVMADRVFNNVLERPIEMIESNKKVSLKISVGISNFPNPTIKSVEDMLDGAVKGLNTAKSHGGNRICVVDS